MAERNFRGNDSRRQDEKDKLNAKLQKYYDDHMISALQLKSKIANIFSSQRNHEYTEKRFLENDLNQISTDLNRAIKIFDTSLLKEKQLIEILEDSDDPFDILMRFRDSAEKMKREVSEIRSKLDDIEERYEITSAALLSRSVRTTAIDIGYTLSEKNGHQIYKFPLQETHKVSANKLRRYEMGLPKLEKDHRHILLTGMTGSGKSLLINNMINYIYGVSFKDNFRFKLIVEDEEIKERNNTESTEDSEEKDASASQAKSMTSWVSSYTFHWQEGFRIDFSLTIIDTPGFGDTRGLQYDEIIIGQIRQFLHNDRLCPNQELTCIGFVIQASQARITDEQRYIFDQVLNLFGKDMNNNIFIVFTFADAQDSPALEVIKSNKIPYAEGCTFKFNNSAVYASKGPPTSRMSWDFGYESLIMFFKSLKQTEHMSLSLTKEVLQKREKLRLVLDSLQNKISNGMDTLRAVEDQINVIVRLNGAINANRDFKIVKKTFRSEIQISDHNITNCNICMQTCHDPCDLSGDRKKACAAMDEEGICDICPKKCSYEKHSNGTHIYVYTPMEVEETIEEMMNEYNIAVGEKNDKKKILESLLTKYQRQKKDVFQSIEQANDYSNQLNEIALRNSYLTNVQYIDRLINLEEVNSQVNKTNRIAQLRHMKAMAETLRDVKENPQKLTRNVSCYEAEIIRIIQNMKDDDGEVD